MNDQEYFREENKKPQSLRSLADYKNKLNNKDNNNNNNNFETELYLSSNELSNEDISIEPNGPEFQNTKVTFISVDSDLSEIFGNVGIYQNNSSNSNNNNSNGNDGNDKNDYNEINESDVSLETDSIHLDELKSNFVLLDENKEIENLRNIITQLKDENDKLIKNTTLITSSTHQENLQLQTELTSLKEQIKNLQFDIKEKDDQIKRGEQSRTMLLSKVNEIDSTKKEKSTLETENEVLKNEKRELTKRISELEKINEGLNGEIQLNKNDIKSYLNNISKLKEDYETKFREYTLLKDSSSKMKIDFDRDLSKLEGDVKRSEEQIRQLQLELSEKTHLEGRFRSDLLTIESKFTQCETENISLRRRLQDVTENRDREVSQYQIKINSLEKEIVNLMDDISRLRRNQSNIGVGVGVGGIGGYSSNSNSNYSNYPSYSSLDRNERLSYPSTSSQYMNEPINSNNNIVDHTNNYSGRYGSVPSSSSISNPSSYDYPINDRDRDRDINKGAQPRSLRGVLEKDPTQRVNEKESNGPRSLGAISNQGDGNISSLKSFVTRGKANQVSGSSPFATEITSSQLRNFEDLERQLTSFMTEKSSLEEELGRLQQRGGRTLKERTRATQIEGRLSDLGRDISKIRRDLATKPN